MTYHQFMEIMEKRVNQFLREGVEAKVQYTTKNNGVQKIGLLFHEDGRSVCPTIYLEELFQDHLERLEKSEENTLFYEKEISHLAFEIIDIYDSAKNRIEEKVKMLFDFQSLKDKVTYRLINYERNKEQLMEMPYERYMDLALVYCVVIEGFSDDEDEKQVGSLYVKTEHMEHWGVTKADLAKVAMNNTVRMFPWKIKSLNSIVGNPCPCDINIEENEIYILSNENYLFGATTILYPHMLRKIAGRLGCDFCVIPSSVHEVLIYPFSDDDNLDIEFLEGMVREVNLSAVEPEEILSECIYIYRRSMDILTY